MQALMDYLVETAKDIDAALSSTDLRKRATHDSTHLVGPAAIL
jgi:hypothetical protein